MDPFFAYYALSISGIVVCVATIKSARAYLDCRVARRTLAAATPLMPTSEEGEVVRVTGVVRIAKTSIAAPLSGRSCVVARARIRSSQDSPFGIGGHPYETFAMVAFIVDAPQIGRVHVEGRYALLDVPSRSMSKRASVPGGREKLIAEHGIYETVRRALYFDETVVEPEMLVSVAGVLMKEAPEQPAAVETGYRESQPPAFVLQGTVAQPLAIGRAPGRGQT